MNKAVENLEHVEEVTRLLSENASSITFDRLPADVVTVTKHCLLDWLAVTMAGALEPLTQQLTDFVSSEGGAPQATLIGTGGKVSAGQAALVNGSAGHALDYDDVLRLLNGHPTAPVMPAILAVAENRGASGRALIEAFVAGVETESRVGGVMGEGHYAGGWHATGTNGHFGAAAGVARLLGLDCATTAMALGIAGTQAAGLKAMFGTMCKPLHAGKAAQNGLFAAEMASRGFISNPAVIECLQGFGDTQTDTFAPEKGLDGIGDVFLIPTIRFKYHAACYGTHAPIDAAVTCRENPAFNHDEVEKIEIRVTSRCLRMCNIPAPTSGLEAKFSLRFTVGLALCGVDTGRLDTFDDAIVGREDVMALCNKGVVVGDDTLERNESRITVHMRDGTVLSQQTDLSAPITDLDLTWGRLQTKFRGLAEPIVGAAQTEQMLEIVSDLENVTSLSPLLAASAP
ncbi:MAG: 2-methylcitrate dehydratase PrpD [Gammaproteobacteria bacterium]|jgi:2-methylcitrate dehydratase PrpD